jgi:uncharacterized protein YkwD
MASRRIAWLSTAALLVVAPAAVAAPLDGNAIYHRHVIRRAHSTGPDCVNADTPAAAASTRAMRQAVVCLINEQRAAHGLPPLHANARLNRAAQGWTDNMIAVGQFTHGVDFASRITAVGFDWSFAGENIATGFKTPRDAVTAWMHSLDHCRNILSPNYASVGTGVSSQPLGPYGPSTWTQDFGLWLGFSPPSHDQGPAAGCPY